MGAFLWALQILPHSEIPTSLIATCATQVLLFFVASAITRHEPNPKNKAIFINFALFFSVPILALFSNFIPDAYSKHYFDQYISYGLYIFLLTLSIVYVSVDVLFRDSRIFYKYLAALAIVGGFFFYYFTPFLLNPNYAYFTQDVRDWKTMSIAGERFNSIHGRPPTVEELARNTDMYVWQEGHPVATLHPDARDRRVAELAPYLVDLNYQILVTKPIMMYMIHMSVLSIGFILLFFGYQYMKDPPQGAYIEKIMFLFLIFCSMEILHAWSAVKALEWQTFASVMGAGQYASLCVLLLITLFFALRLRFITSAHGEFYEQELATRPGSITRWRDTLDNMVVDSFFNRRALVGRLFAPAGRREQHFSPKPKLPAALAPTVDHGTYGT
jgi:hypothetical protein